MGDLISVDTWLREHGQSSAIEERKIRMSTEKPAPSMDDVDLQVPSNVTPIRRLQPGDVLDVVRKLRSLGATYETTSYTLFASFSDLGGPELEKEAEKTRHTLELASARIFALLSLLEQTQAYQDIRREALSHRKERYERAQGDK